MKNKLKNHQSVITSAKRRDDSENARHASPTIYTLTDNSMVEAMDMKHVRALKDTIARLESRLIQKERQVIELSTQL